MAKKDEEALDDHEDGAEDAPPESVLRHFPRRGPPSAAELRDFKSIDCLDKVIAFRQERQGEANRGVREQEHGGVDEVRPAVLQAVPLNRHRRARAISSATLWPPGWRRAAAALGEAPRSFVRAKCQARRG
jgi:hypothetical protein